MVTDRQSRIALTIVFASTGFFTGTWFARIPAVKSAFHLSNGRLGLALACTTIGAVIASPLAGFLSSRLGSQNLLRLSAPATALTFAGMGLAPSVPVLVVALSLMGVMNGFVQVSMNAQAVALEGRYGRTILSTMHGGFSIGMMAGALVAALAAWLGVSYHANLAVVSALLFCVAIAIGFFLLDAEKTALAHRRRMHLSLALVVLIVVAFFELFCEGAATAWSAVYTRHVGGSGAIAALVFAAYSLTMTAGRLRGDRIVLRLGVGGVVGLGGLIATVGMALAVAMPMRTFVLVGFALYGLGLSCLAPTLFRAAGQLPLPEGQGIAALLGAAWPAFLLVGPLIGGIADATSLRTALLVPIAAALLVAALGSTVGRFAPVPVGRVEAGPAV